jgi:hypothetical protein
LNLAVALLAAMARKADRLQLVNVSHSCPMSGQG